MPIKRSYSCLNRRCRYEFDSDGDFPPCPRCRGLRVQWVPKPVAINSSRTAAIDTTVRELASDFGLSNFRSPTPGQAAVAPGATASASDGNYFEPQKGWRIKLPDAALSGAGHAVCAPAGVTAKIKVDPNGPALSPNPNFGPDKLRAATTIEATHRGRIPR